MADNMQMVVEQVTLAKCPVGLFWCGDTLALKTEYGSNEGRIDAYIVSSGEFFWGHQPQSIANQRATLVTPVDSDFAEASLHPKPESADSGDAVERGDKLVWARSLDRRPLAVVGLESVTVASWGTSWAPLAVTLQEVAGSFPMGWFDRVPKSRPTLNVAGEGVREAEETIREALMDSQYLAGVTAGWNAAQSDDPEASLSALHKSREGYLKGYKAAKGFLATQPQADSAAMREATPIDMILHCPRCHLQHIDEPDERTHEWENPPHRSHLCHGCGCIWRPADVPTNGVAKIATVGKADTPLATTPSEPIADAVAGEHPDGQLHEHIGGQVANMLGIEGGGADYWRMRVAIVEAITTALRTPADNSAPQTPTSSEMK